MTKFPRACAHGLASQPKVIRSAENPDVCVVTFRVAAQDEEHIFQISLDDLRALGREAEKASKKKDDATGRT